MADVTEIIHTITYEVNNDALNNATNAIQLQIKELHQLNNSLRGYTQQLHSLGAEEQKQLDQLSKKIDKVLGGVEKSFSKTQGVIQQLGKGVLKGLDISNDLESLVAKSIRPFREELDKVGTTGTRSFAKLGKSLTSVTSLIDIGLNVVFALANKFFEATKRVDSLKGVLEETKDVMSSFASTAANELGNLGKLFAVINNVNTSYAQKKTAITELRGAYRSYLKDLSDEEILAGKVGVAYDRIVDSIYTKARLQAFQNKFNGLIAKELELQEQIDVLKPLIPETKGTTYKVVEDGPLKGQKIEQFDYALWTTQQIQANNKIKQLEEEQNKIIAARVKYFEKIKELVGQIAPTTTPTFSNPPKKDKNIRPETLKEPLYLEPRKVDFLSTTIEPPKLEKAAMPQLEEDQKGLTDKQKENIEKGISGYQQLSQAAANAYNTIIQAQIDALDKEISIREKRVERAKKLAERGNTEVLKLEEDRLRKAEQKRAQFAKRQQAINAAITVSNAIAAVARAALEGGGFGSAATIAALIAALAAGYGAVTSMSQDGGAFADGVVDYKGKGGPREDRNWVRISSGESVITADGTQRNRALLEAINNGAVFNTLTSNMPMLQQPKNIYKESHYATTKELSGLEKKLDDVVYAIEGNKLKQNIHFDEQGVGIMTEKAINKNRKRWM